MTGNSYAIPTMTRNFKPLPLELIRKCVATFVEYAKANMDKKFFVTRVGCGYVGYMDEQIAPMFRGCPGNCDMPEGWRVYLENKGLKSKDGI